MNVTDAQNLACPIDGEKLELSGKQLVCSNRHSYDIARQGYVHLLPVQHKRSKQPGDSKAMVLARSQFLDTGIYQPVAEKLNDIVQALITGDEDTCLLDAGCGEGYYSDSLLNTLSAKTGSAKLSFIGLDISKDAILQASKRNKLTSWIVGTNRQPPVMQESVDIILCMFGFFSFDGFDKILKPGGKVILVDPGPDHLRELRQLIYHEVKKTGQADLPAAINSGYTELASESLQFTTKLTDREQINRLLIMTPHFYRASKEGKEAASLLTELETTVHVIYRVLQKA